MDKNKFIKELAKKTEYDEEKCILINNVIESHFIIGHNNKEKIKKDFNQKLNVSWDEADKLYNICSEIIVKGIFK